MLVFLKGHNMRLYRQAVMQGVIPGKDTISVLEMFKVFIGTVHVGVKQRVTSDI